MVMAVEDKDTIPLCSGSEDIQHQVPSSEFEFKYKNEIENMLGLGEYRPFHTMHKPSEFMFKLSSFKYVHKNYDGFRILLDQVNDYIETWQNCVKAHENQDGTFCYDQDFRTLMNGSFENIRSGLSELSSYSETDFADFDKNLEFTRYWNNIQHTISETFYAHLVGYPKWLGVDSAPQSPRATCAGCKVLNNIGPPPLTFISLSACFMPYVTHLPDGTVIPEGVLVNEKASELHILHEHIHAYLHEKKVPEQKHVHCEWVDEGIADWAAVKILEPDIKEKSFFMELYDFWIILNSIKEEECKQIVENWCNEPEKFQWREFVKDAINCIREYRNESREKMVWFSNENCNFKFDFEKYIK
jgi:hypothetical protein